MIDDTLLPFDLPAAAARSTAAGSRRTAGVAAIEHDREQCAHALDLVDRSAWQRAVAIVFGECDEEIGPVIFLNESEIRGKQYCAEYGGPHTATVNSRSSKSRPYCARR